MGDFKLQYKPFGERSILIEWPQIISKKTLKDVLLYKKKIENHYFKEKVYIKSAYNSILISYSLAINNFYNEVLVLNSIYFDELGDDINDSKLWKIPVCYDVEFGLDLEDISFKKNIEISNIIELHTATNYLVYFIGFLPGFLYLGGLDEQLYFPRKNAPRLYVKKGSVAIGGSQTGVYPNKSPGGWNIIGNTPLDFFNITNQSPCFAKAGDRIQFVSVSKSCYYEILSQVKSNEYTIESEVIYD
ncbi:5-oxoprolinase subunit PxpB [Pontimicrobium aquaticum]|uniref:5-oxoprolinase subunit PxpB n=1 Tax=Pontimicrobium aquaticum TaxID=2565367 RepID=A0A4U0ERD7_9FLAO|nr:5-oxoprolinase subunit PxpB [Pontimicrobium aquaticum]